MAAFLEYPVSRIQNPRWEAIICSLGLAPHVNKPDLICPVKRFAHPPPPISCFSGGARGERGSPRTSGGEEGEGAQSPPQPAGGPHQQRDPVRVSPEGGGHRVSVSTRQACARTP